MPEYGSTGVLNQNDKKTLDKKTFCLLKNCFYLCSALAQRKGIKETSQRLGRKNGAIPARATFDLPSLF